MEGEKKPCNQGLEFPRGLDPSENIKNGGMTWFTKAPLRTCWPWSTWLLSAAAPREQPSSGALWDGFKVRGSWSLLLSQSTKASWNSSVAEASPALVPALCAKRSLLTTQSIFSVLVKCLGSTCQALCVGVTHGGLSPSADDGNGVPGEQFDVLCESFFGCPGTDTGQRVQHFQQQSPL